MPLSEHEQKLLEQMEQQLLADDPRFATTMRDQRRSGSTSPRRGALGITAIVVGLAIVVLALFFNNLWLGIPAIVLMFGGLVIALTGGGQGDAQSGPTGVVGPDGSRRPAPAQTQKRRKAGSSGSGTFMQRLEQRWDRRRDDGR